jgi:hypothetical protein
LTDLFKELYGGYCDPGKVRVCDLLPDIAPYTDKLRQRVQRGTGGGSTTYQVEQLQPSAAYDLATRLSKLLKLPLLPSEFSSPEQQQWLLEAVAAAQQEFFCRNSGACGLTDKGAAASRVVVAATTGRSSTKDRRRSRSNARTAVPSPVADRVNSNSSGGSFGTAAAADSAHAEIESGGTAVDLSGMEFPQVAGEPEVRLTVAEAVNILDAAKRHGLAYCKDFQPLLLMIWSTAVARKQELQQGVKGGAAEMQLSQLLQHWDAWEGYQQLHLTAGTSACCAARDACNTLQLMLLYLHQDPRTAAAVGRQQMEAVAAATKAFNARVSELVFTAGGSGSGSGAASHGSHEQLQVLAAAAAAAARSLEATVGVMATSDPLLVALPAAPATTQTPAPLAAAQLATVAVTAELPAPVMPTSAIAAPTALVGGGETSLDKADRKLQQQFRAQLQPAVGQLRRFRQAMLELRRLPAGHPKLDRFWADREVSWLCCM